MEYAKIEEIQNGFIYRVSLESYISKTRFVKTLKEALTGIEKLVKEDNKNEG